MTLRNVSDFQSFAVQTDYVQTFVLDVHLDYMELVGYGDYFVIFSDRSTRFLIVYISLIEQSRSLYFYSWTTKNYRLTGRKRFSNLPVIDESDIEKLAT